MEKQVLTKLHNTEKNILEEIDMICKKNDIKYFLIFGTLLGAIRHNGFIPWDDDIDIGMTRKDYKKFKKICKKELNNNRFIIDDYSTNSQYYLPWPKVRLKNTIMLEKFDSDLNGNHGIWIDIFLYDNVTKENSIFHKFRWKICDCCFTLLTIKFNRNYYKASRIKLKVLKILLRIIPARFITFISSLIIGINKNEKSQYLCTFGGGNLISKETNYRGDIFPTVQMEFENKKYPCPNNYKKVLEKEFGSDYMTLPPKEKRITHNPQVLKFEDGEEHDFKNGKNKD